jgi:prepilin-type N-terminal cleavage/methylation domain-containing protein
MRRSGGFTLIELAISLAIVGLLLAMFVVPLGTQVDQRRISDTQKQLDLVTESILGFAVANGRLPCPAVGATANTVAGAGTENRAGGACVSSDGVLPWATLGLPETDAWGRRFTYRVTVAMADDPTGGVQSSFTLTDDGNITVKSAAAGVTVASNVAAVIVSHGKNGLGAYQPTGVQIAGAAGDELENANADATFVNKLPDSSFDDVVAWVSPNVLKSRMVAANRLP